MTLMRFTLSLALIATAFFAWSYFSILRAETRTQVQIGLLTRELASLRSGPVSGESITCPTLNSTDSEALTKIVTAAVMSNLKERLPALASRPSPSSTSPVEPTDAQRAAVEQAQQILQSAISVGILTRTDVLQMRDLKLQSGGGPAFDELTQQIFQALNQQRIIPEDPTMVVP
jgi:hypothetical protein